MPIANATTAWWDHASVRGFRPAWGAADPALDYPMNALPHCVIGDSASFDREARAIATGLWLHYNWRTIQAEERIALPAIDYLVRSTALDDDTKEALLQTAIDEKFHTYLHTMAIREAERRYSRAFEFGDSVTVRELEAALLQEPDAGNKELIRLAYAVVAEISVNAFLEVLSKEKAMRAENRNLVDRHNRDERFHTVIFLEVVKQLMAAEDRTFASYLRTQIVKARSSFLRHDVQMYQRVFAAHQVPVEFAASSGLMSRDMSGIDRLLEAVAA